MHCWVKQLCGRPFPACLTCTPEHRAPFAPCTLPPRKTSFSSDQEQLAAWEKTWSFEARGWECGRHRCSFKNSYLRKRGRSQKGISWIYEQKEVKSQRGNRKRGKGRSSSSPSRRLWEVHAIAYPTFLPSLAKLEPQICSHSVWS